MKPNIQNPPEFGRFQRHMLLEHGWNNGSLSSASCEKVQAKIAPNITSYFYLMLNHKLFAVAASFLC